MTSQNIFLFIPNIIGYIRILLAICSVIFMWLDKPVLALTTYILSSVMDALDGNAARYFNQCIHIQIHMYYICIVSSM